MKPAVFLDRDGVIVELVMNPATGGYEPPCSPNDLVLVPEAIPSLSSLRNAGFDLFLVSNQPDYAKGKATLDQIHAVHAAFDRLLQNGGIRFRHYYYCYHHPQGIVPEYSGPCDCRKPRPGFLLAAARDYGIDLPRSWMIGDRDADVECGKAAGTRTILIRNPRSSRYRGSSEPDFQSANLKEAVREILNTTGTDGPERIP
ncbi:MAG TPA: HAD family hydrolase [Methanoregulaceae archaeon]|nr:HAD family hydrolase [Methanoregulaceae archaeon]